MNYLIETPRLRLREMEETDDQFMLELNSDPEVMRYTGDRAFDSLAHALDIVRYVRRQYAEHGMGRLVVELRSTCEPIGWCGLKYHPERDGEVDLGYRYLRRFWGQGYGLEAARACVEFGFEKLKLPRLIARSMEDNTGSRRILEKIDFQWIGKEMDTGGEFLVFEKMA